MTTLDICVLLLGVLVSGLVGAGFVMTVYGYAFSEQSTKEHPEPSSNLPLVQGPLKGEPSSSRA